MSHQRKILLFGILLGIGCFVVLVFVMYGGRRAGPPVVVSRATRAAAPQPPKVASKPEAPSITTGNLNSASKTLPQTTPSLQTNHGALLPEPTQTITGSVEDSNGKPVEGASIFDTPPGHLQEEAKRAPATSDATGRFTLKRRTQYANWPVFAWRSGYALGWAYPQGGNVTVVLSAGGAIKGVCTRDGLPAEGVHVTARNSEGWPLGESITGALGSYKIEGLPSGMVNVNVDVKGEAGFGERWVEIVEGQSVIADFSLHSQKAHVTGTAYVDGEPTGIGTINLVVAMAGGGYQVIHGGVHPDGTFEFKDVPLGQAMLSYRGRNVQRSETCGNASFEIAGDGDIVQDISVRTDNVLKVQLVRADHSGGEACVLVLSGALSAGGMSWLEIPELTERAAAMGNPKEDGVCRFVGLAKGTYSVIGLTVPAVQNSGADIVSTVNQTGFDLKVVQVKDGAETTVTVRPTRAH